MRYPPELCETIAVRGSQASPRGALKSARAILCAGPLSSYSYSGSLT